MRIDVPFGLMINFGLVLCRTAGIMAFLPIPGLKSAFEISRLALAVLFAILLLPWAGDSVRMMTLSDMALAAVSEAGLGIGLGLCVALISEGLMLGAQMIGLQAGFSYSSTIDPTSNADSAILQVLLNLSGALMFLAMGLDTVLFRILLEGTKLVPPGQWLASKASIGVLIPVFTSVFTDAIRCALPVVGIVLVIDLTLALLSRVQPAMQLLSLSFPLKILAALAVLSFGTGMLPGVVERSAVRSLEAVAGILHAGSPAAAKEAR